MEKVLHIASGESVATYLKNYGTSNVFAFNEAMCEGDADADFFSQEFCRKRAEAYQISEDSYIPFYRELAVCLRDAERLELYFDHDMFCAVNTITLLAFLEEVKFSGKIHFNLIAQDGTATVLESFPIVLGGFGNVYRQVLINRTSVKTGVKHLDAGIELYLAYKKPDNEIVRYIKENQDMPRKELCRAALAEFADYGVGDMAILRMIDEVGI